MKNQAGNFKLGLMVTTAFALFTVAVYLIGSRQNMFGDSFHISAVFKNVNGLQTGNNVRYAGINVGTVDRILIVSDSTVEVWMTIRSDVRKFIKKDAYASIGSDGLVGNMLVNISPGSGNQPQVNDNDRIKSFSRTDTDDILSTLSSTNENIALLSRDLLTTTQYINQGQGTITALLRDTTLLVSIKNSLSNLESVTAQSSNIVKKLETFSSELDNKDNLLNLLLSDTSYSYELKKVVASINSASENLDQVTEELHSASSALLEGDGPLNTLFYDSIVSIDIKESISNINESSILLKENMEAMREHFLFRKYFKKQEKENP
jgi:phospholipid/cholesterol/gamma-HCH transport system substrate-binding protein